MNISLIIPTYFEENLLEQLLKEFTYELKQKYNFELIVSDGGSTNATISIAKKYVDKLVVKTKEERQTIAEGRNDGAKAAEGEVLVFLNADCISSYTQIDRIRPFEQFFRCSNREIF